jgi:hypothetical protein
MKCFACGGEGGEKEAILDDGSGPWYECTFCNGLGELSFFKGIYLYTIFWKYGILTYEQEKRKKFTNTIKRLKRITNV